MSLAELKRRGFDAEATNHAAAILSRDFPSEYRALCDILLSFEIRCAEMLQGGGGEAPMTKRLRETLYSAGWPKRNIRVTKNVDGEQRFSTTHEIDHVLDCDRGTLALEIEWNNKDPFFDRDLENFQRLHADGAISVGIVLTRGSTLQSQMFPIVLKCAKGNNLRGFGDFARLGIKAPTANQRKAIRRRLAGSDFTTAVSHVLAGKYGESTTHWTKLKARIARGVGNPCPLLLVGLRASCVTY